jgi:hypothetical protein
MSSVCGWQNSRGGIGWLAGFAIIPISLKKHSTLGRFGVSCRQDEQTSVD